MPIKTTGRIRFPFHCIFDHVDLPPSYYLKVDTFLLPSSLKKGQLFVNGVNLGRYWPAKGPQQTLFIPRDVIKFGLNEIFVFELEPEVEKPQVNLVDKPKLDKWA